MEPKISKLLGGGLNLLAPGDATPEGQSLVAQNWRTDQAGNLKSRKSNGAAIVTFPDTVTSILTALRSAGPQQYFGAADKWYRGSTLIASALSGDPLQQVSFQGRVWCMNPAEQRKDDGANTYLWTPGPAPAPTWSN